MDSPSAIPDRSESLRLLNKLDPLLREALGGHIPRQIFDLARDEYCPYVCGSRTRPSGFGAGRDWLADHPTDEHGRYCVVMLGEGITTVVCDFDLHYNCDGDFTEWPCDAAKVGIAAFDAGVQSIESRLNWNNND